MAVSPIRIGLVIRSGNGGQTDHALRLKPDHPMGSGQSLFYDKDHIRAGQKWQERLREELQSCRIVLVVLSRNWLSSPWCFAEVVTATFRGKDVVGIAIEDLTSADLQRAPPILNERQRIRLQGDGDGQWKEILEALDRSGLDPDDWFPIPADVGPYPGLVAFDEKDAGVYFGRKQEITDYLGILDTLQGPDRSQILVISGASGSGKSSLLRAGLIPRLRRMRNWVVISPFEVAREPVRNLLDCLKQALESSGVSLHELDLATVPATSEALAQVVDEALRRLERASNAWVLLPLDQAEGLLAGNRQAHDPALLLLNALAQVLGRRIRRVVVVSTIRTEFVPRLETAFEGSAVHLRQVPLGTIRSLAEVIERPAERFGLELEPGLAGTIVNDVHTADALPLLAYTLRILHKRGGTDRRLTFDEYRTLGGVQGAIGAKLEKVLTDPKPSGNEIQGLQRAFSRHLVRVDEDAVEGERLLRRVVARTSLPQTADRVIGRLIDAGLLVTKSGTIELAHERLINDWPGLPLKTWLAEDLTNRRLIDRLRQRVDDDKLPDGLLAQAEELLHRDPELKNEERAISDLVRRSRDQKQKAEQRRRGILGITVMAAFVFAAVSVYALWQRNVASNQTGLAERNAANAAEAARQARAERDRARIQLLAVQARRVNDLADTQDEVELAGTLALESMQLAQESHRSAEADSVEVARIALSRLPLQVLSHGSRVIALAGLPDGRLASGGVDGQIKIWTRDGKGAVVREQGTSVTALTSFPDGRVASGDTDGHIKIWPQDDKSEPLILEHGSLVRDLAVLPDGRLVSSGGENAEDSKIKVWPQDGHGEPLVIQSGKIVSSLALLPNGYIAISGGNIGTPDNSQIVILRQDGKGEPVILNHGDSVYALAALPDGRLVSGGFRGEIKIWSHDGKGEPLILPGGKTVMALAAFPDGRIASTSAGLESFDQHPDEITIEQQDGEGEPFILYHGSPVWVLAALPDGRLASASEDGEIKIWPHGGTDEPTIFQRGIPVYDLATLADGRLASGDDDGRIKIWAHDFTGEPLVLEHGGRVMELAAFADGRIASGGEDHQIKIWSKDGGGAPSILQHDSLIQAMVALPDGRLASGGGYTFEGSEIRIWPKEGIGEPLILQNGGEVWTMAVLSDGRLASGSTDGEVKIWANDFSGEPVVLQHGNFVRSIAAFPDGRFATGGDSQIKIWPKDGNGAPLVLRDSNDIGALAILADGRVASNNGLFVSPGQIKIWPIDGKGAPIILEDGGPADALSVLPDGRLASAGKGDTGGQIKVWLVGDEQLISALCRRASRNFTKDEWVYYIGSDTPWQPSCRNVQSNWRNSDQ